MTAACSACKRPALGLQLRVTHSTGPVPNNERYTVKLKTKGYKKTKSGYRSLIVRVHEDDVSELDKAAAKKGLTRSQAVREAIGDFTGYEPAQPRALEA